MRDRDTVVPEQQIVQQFFRPGCICIADGFSDGTEDTGHPGHGRHYNQRPLSEPAAHDVAYPCNGLGVLHGRPAELHYDHILNLLTYKDNYFPGHYSKVLAMVT